MNSEVFWPVFSHFEKQTKRNIPSASQNHGRQTRKVDTRKLLRFALISLATILVTLGARHWWREERWRYIIVHHTASDVGDLEYYRRMHMEEHDWPDIAYHFVVDNGNGNTSVGQVEESNLWKERSINYSTKISYVNYFGIAVVMVGNFDKHPVPDLQREALVQLLTRLSREYSIPPERIVGHREVWQTHCPGKYLNMVEIREEVRRNLETLKDMGASASGNGFTKPVAYR